MKYYSQIGQDQLVDKILGEKTSGTFLDVGASFYDNMNNTFFFEKEREWRGVAVEINSIYNDGWLMNRPKSIYINQDALEVDYQNILDKYHFPKVIDYLTVDLDPPEVTYKTFCKIMDTDYQFNVITFEVDYWGETRFRDTARQMMTDKGYVLAGEIHHHGKHIDDLFIHSSIYKDTMKL